MAGLELISLMDPTTGASARIAPSLGFNCFEFRANGTGDEMVDVIWREDGFEAGGKRASGSGIPLLFPFPGRIAGTTLSWDDRSYQLEAGDGRGNAIHGFVHERPWRVMKQNATSVVGQFHAAVDDPQLLKHWPTDFRITATYEIGPNELRSTFLLENPDDGRLPCGFGIHPYFTIPLGGKSASNCRIRLPVSTTWELADMLPTGSANPLEEATLFQNGQTFETLELDDVFGGLTFDSPFCAAMIEDPDSGNRMMMSFDDSFRECVVYTPPHREAICIEPLTCVPDPFRLQPQGVDAGLRILESGESFSSSVDLSINAVAE